jgi:hypothetical protein
MDALFVLGCLCAVFVPVILGLGLSYIFERYIGGWAFVVGTLASLILFAGLYTVNFIWTKATGCEPADSLACGEPFIGAFALFFGVILFVALATAAAQFAFYVFLNNLRNPALPVAATYEPSPVPGYPTQSAEAETSPEIAAHDPAAFASQSAPVEPAPAETRDDDEPQPIPQSNPPSQNIYDWAPNEDVVDVAADPKAGQQGPPGQSGGA